MCFNITSEIVQNAQFWGGIFHKISKGGPQTPPPLSRMEIKMEFSLLPLKYTHEYVSFQYKEFPGGQKAVQIVYYNESQLLLFFFYKLHR